MDNENEYVLRKFYNELYNYLILDYKIINESIIITFLKPFSNKRYEMLSNTALDSFKFKRSVIDSLITDEMIRPTEEANKYSITAKGVWKIELTDGKISDQIILEYIDKNYFSVFKSDEPLVDKEKVVLLSMISVRSFSEHSALNFHDGQHIIQSWKSVLDKCGMFLKDFSVIKDYPGKMYGKGGNEFPAIYLQERVNELFKKSRGLYKSPGNRIYYLDLYNNHIKENLSLLFWLIFGKKLTFDNVDIVIDFCNNVAYEMCIHIFKDIDQHIFLNPEYDDTLKNSILEVVLSENEW